MFKKFGVVVGGVAGALSIVALVGWAVWAVMLTVEPNAARLWALIATIALPAVGAGCYWLGSTEARGTLKGFDLGVSKIFGTTVRAAKRRSYMGMASQYVNPQLQGAPLVLPQVEFTDVGGDGNGVVSI